MKYLISRVEYKKGDSLLLVDKVSIETDNIELTRKELHQSIEADKILFVYTQLQ